MMKGKKYVVIPGEVRSRNDGDMHYLDAPKLMRLYGVRHHECIVMKGDLPPELEYKMALRYGLEILMPRYDGNYLLTEKLTSSEVRGSNDGA